MERIKEKDIESLLKTLNKKTNNPTETWNTKKHCHNPGNIYLQGVSGYYNLDRVSNEGGGAGHLAQGLTKRQAYDWLRAAITGIDLLENKAGTF